MKNLCSTAILVIFLILVGCSENFSESSGETDVVIEGIVVTIEGNQIFLVEAASSEDVQGLTEDDILNKSYLAIYITLPDDININVHVGDKVKAWLKNLDTSMPAYGEAVKVEIK